MSKPRLVTRRSFLKGIGLGAVGATASCSFGRTEPLAWLKKAKPAQTVLPRWRGFNLVDMLYPGGDNVCREDDFRWIRDWGFGFVRVPLGYHIWHSAGNAGGPKESNLEKVDQAVELGQRYGIHVNVAFFDPHGLFETKEKEAFRYFWKDPALLDAFYSGWATFAERYKGRSSSQLSFNLMNEPPMPTKELMTLEDHERAVRRAVEVIREADPKRLIISDGVDVGRAPRPDLKDLGIAQSCRGYVPGGLNSYKAEWSKRTDWSLPTWPMEDRGKFWDRQALVEYFRPWADLAGQGVGIHCGETGAYNKTPHPVVLAWLRDMLDILKGYNIGYALWNFRGSHGILDSQRQDVAYEDFHGHKLDRKLLSLLQSF